MDQLRNLLLSDDNKGVFILTSLNTLSGLVWGNQITHPMEHLAQDHSDCVPGLLRLCHWTTCIWITCNQNTQTILGLIWLQVLKGSFCYFCYSVGKNNWNNGLSQSCIVSWAGSELKRRGRSGSVTRTFRVGPWRVVHRLISSPLFLHGWSIFTFIVKGSQVPPRTVVYE